MNNTLVKEENFNIDNVISYNAVQSFKVRTMRVKDYITDREKEQVFILKQLDDDDEDILMPSRLTSYIKTRCCNNSLNTAKKKAEMVTQFLNYTIKEVKLGYNKHFNCLKEKGLYGLTLYHLADYITSLRDINSYETVKKKEHTLLDFYDYLYQLGITGEEGKIEKIPVPVKKEHNAKREVVWQIVNPFAGNPDFVIEYPDTESSGRELLKDMDDELWNTFVEFAQEKYPGIAFGLLLQICSGIRTGELMNLTLNSIEVYKRKNYMTLSIQDRQKELFNRDVDTRHSQCKKPREGQPAFNFNGKLFDMYDEHLKHLKKQKNRKNNSALFIDSQGQPMTGQVYQAQFHKMKWDFIAFIEDDKPSVAEELSIKCWGSHIGRHIYTNHLIRHGYLKNIMGYSDPKLLMVLRGDSSVKSSEVYLDLKNITESVANQIDMIGTIAVSMKK